MKQLRTPLSRVKGLGSAKEGTHHFWHQRLTALILTPLIVWFAFSLAALPVDHAMLVSWVQQPLVTVGLIFLVAATFYHAQLGLQVIIEDYVSTHSTRTLCIIGSNILCLIFATTGIVSVLNISFGA